VADGSDAYTLTLTVKNTGTVAGKDIVQIYLQSPYTDYDKANSIEKSAVELVGYAKTSNLAAGASESVSITVPKELLKVYDAYGHGTYIVDAGDYYLSAGENAHDALNNILAAKGKTVADGMDAAGDAALAHHFTLPTLDSTKYSESVATGNAITNQFATGDIRYYDPSFKYLSRSDWTGTWPTVYANGSWTAPQQLLKDLELVRPDDPDAITPTYGTTDENYGKLTSATLIGIDYDNDLWDALLNQASLSDLDMLTRVGGYATQLVDSIQLPGTVDKDGPAGLSSSLVGGKPGAAYPPEIVIASTWNDAIAEAFGRAIGEDSLSLGVTGWYAPAMNIHRTPYSGRNFEYYSEDGFLSGKMGAATVRGAQSKGVLVYIKHFAVNDQETSRMGGAMFANEQAIRSIYLKGFELSVREGGARGVMVSMNRIGARWTGGHEGLMTATLREEWGFQGVAITDQASYSVFSYEDMREGLAAGTDLWLNSDASLWQLSSAELTPSVQADIHRAAHNVAYAIINSNAMNGLASDSRVVAVTPAWRIWLIVADVVLVLGALTIAGVVTRKLITQRRRDDGSEPETESESESSEE
jgi:beta-glucosidase